MNLPTIGTSTPEELGVLAVANAVFRPQSDGGLGFIFREQPKHDFGIDGHIEIVDRATNEATGKIIGVQIKSGPSFFTHPTNGGWTVYIRKETVNYWRQYSVPVVMAVVDTGQNVVYWVVVSDGAFEGTKRSYKVFVPEAQRLDSSAADAISELAITAPALLAAQLERLMAEFSSSTAAELQRHRLNWREGRRRDARAWAESLTGSSARLAALDPAVAARVLRFAAGIVLDEETDVETAERLANDARQRDSTGNDRRLRAAILVRQGEIDAALSLLAGSNEPGDQIMRASLLARFGDRSAASAALNQVKATTAFDLSDWWRTVAWLRFEGCDFAGAREAATRAKEHGAAYAQVRLLRAVLTYYDGVVTEGIPADLSPWPYPLPAAFVRRDRPAVESFEAAAEEFGELLRLDWTAGERRHIETWRLAALAAIPEGQAAAAAFAREVLGVDRSQPFVLLWVATEELPVRTESHVKALESEVERTEDVGLAKIYVAARMASGDTTGLSAWLDAWQERFSRANALPEWTFWRAHLFIAGDEVEQASALIEGMDAGPAQSLTSEILAAEARRTGESAAFIEHLEAVAEASGESQFLFRACQEMARGGLWERVVPHIDELLSRLPTPPVRRLAIFARYNTGDFAGCIPLLQDAFERQEIQDVRELRRIRADVRLRTGDLPGAIADLEAVTAVSGERVTALDLLTLVRARFFAGQRHELAATARRLRGRIDLRLADALMLCEVIVHDDEHLASEFWRHAVQGDLPDEHVAGAVGLGYRLGLDSEMGKLHERMAGLAASGDQNIQQISLDELVARHREWGEEKERMLDLYRRGETPTHMVADFLNEPLVHLYHAIPTWNEEQFRLTHSFALQLRDGSRGLPQHGSSLATAGKLGLDLSALLLAAHLELLPDLEQQFAPLRLPHSVIVALREQRDKLRPHQPSRVDLSNTLIAAERKRQIRPWQADLPFLEDADFEAAGNWWRWVALLERARRENAFVLDLPLTDDATEARPTEFAGKECLARLVAVSDIRLSLAAAGAVHVRNEEGAEAGTSEPNDGASQAGNGKANLLPPGATVYMTDAGAEGLAKADLLRPAAELYTLLVDPADQDARRAQLEAMPELRERADWLDRLIQRVADGLSDGRYALLPSVVGIRRLREGSHDEAEGDDRRSLAVQSLRQLLSLAPGSVDAVCIDDRFINRHRFASTIRLTDLLEVIAALEAVGQLSAQRRWSLFIQLRSANVRVVPLSAAEIIHHLHSAPFTNGVVVETPALRIIRQYSAAVLGDAGNLRMPSADQLATGDTGELEVVRGYAAAVREALLEVWRLAKSDEGDSAVALAKARSSWLIRSLYLNLGLLRIHAQAPNAGAETGVSAFDTAALLVSAIPLISDTQQLSFGGGDALAAEYAAWLYEAVIEGRFTRDPEFRTALVEQLKAILLQWSQPETGESDDRIYGKLIAGKILDALPDVLRDRLGDDSDFMESIGRVVVSSISVGGWHVGVADFAKAAAALLSSGEDGVRKSGEGSAAGALEVPVLESDPPVTLLLARNGTGLFSLSLPDSTETVHLRDPAFGVMSADEAARRAACEAVRQDADYSTADWRIICDRIIAIEDPDRRFENLVTHRDGALDSRYAAMKERWTTEGKISQDDLRAPLPSEVLRHLRIEHPLAPSTGSASAEDTTGWERAGEVLMSEDGLEVAFHRLAGVPVPIPACVLEGIRDWPVPERDALVRRLLRPTSPLGEVHLLRVLSLLGSDDTRYLRLCRRRLRRLAEPTFEGAVRALGLVARAAYSWLKLETPDARSPGEPGDVAVSPSAPEWFVASWYHAHRFISTVVAEGGDPAALVDWLEDRVVREGSLFGMSDGAQEDLAAPDLMRPHRFVVGGLQYVGKGTALLEVAEAALDALQEWLTHTVDDKQFPHIDLLLDLCDHPDTLGCWIQPEREVDGRIILGNRELVPSSVVPDALREQALVGLEGNPTAAGSWITLQIVAGSDPLKGSDAEQFDRAMTACDLGALLSDLGEVGPIAAARLARQAWDDPERRNRLRADLLLLSKLDLDETTGTAPTQGVQEGLPDHRAGVLEALYTLAGAEGEPADAMRAFIADLSVLSQNDSSFLRHIRSVLERLVLERPIEEAAVCVGLLLEARGT